MGDLQSRQNCRLAAEHYDELDIFYRKLWGEHLHHGLWKTGKETTHEAVLQLSRMVADAAQISFGDDVCDIGSGYGATARLLANERNANMTALTVSATQFQYAKSLDQPGNNPKYLLGDWLENTLPSQSFDAVIAIESSEHIENKAKFFKEIYRVLRPGGRLAICAWLAKENPKNWEKRYLLKPICLEKRLPGMETAENYRRWITKSGLENVEFHHLTPHVKKTWTICTWRFVKAFLTDAHLRDLMMNETSSNRIFAKTMFRIWTAYQSGSMRYGMFTAEKP